MRAIDANKQQKPIKPALTANAVFISMFVFSVENIFIRVLAFDISTLKEMKEKNGK